VHEVIRIETYDGEIHTTEKKAEAYLGKEFANILCPIIHKIHGKKFVEIGEFIENNLEAFEKLKNIKNDKRMELQ